MNELNPRTLICYAQLDLKENVNKAIENFKKPENKLSLSVKLFHALSTIFTNEANRNCVFEFIKIIKIEGKSKVQAEVSILKMFTKMQEGKYKLCKDPRKLIFDAQYEFNNKVNLAVKKFEALGKTENADTKLILALITIFTGQLDEIKLVFEYIQKNKIEGKTVAEAEDSILKILTKMKARLYKQYKNPLTEDPYLIRYFKFIRSLETSTPESVTTFVPANFIRPRARNEEQLAAEERAAEIRRFELNNRLNENQKQFFAQKPSFSLEQSSSSTSLESDRFAKIKEMAAGMHIRPLSEVIDPREYYQPPKRTNSPRQVSPRSSNDSELPELVEDELSYELKPLRERQNQFMSKYQDEVEERASSNDYNLKNLLAHIDQNALAQYQQGRNTYGD